MSDRFVIGHLRQLPPFERLSPQQLGSLSTVTQVMRYEPGAAIFSEGQPALGMYVFVNGRGMLTRRNAQGFEEQIAYVASGQYINEASLYQDMRETATLRVVEQSIILFISRRGFANLISRMPEIRANLRTPSAEGAPAMPSSAPQRAQASEAAPGTTGTPAPRPPTARSAPQKLFTGQRDDETVLHIFKRHPWAFLRYFWLPILVMIGASIGGLILSAQIGLFGIALSALGIILPGILMFYMYFEWRDDLLVLTDQRVVNIWHHLLRFENTINEIPLERILEVNYEIPPADPPAQLFNYGTLAIKTAGEAANLSISLMPDPKNIQTLIFEQRDRVRLRGENRNRQAIESEIQRALGINGGAQAFTEGSIGRRMEPLGIPFIRTRFMNSNGEIVWRRHSSVWLEHVFLPTLLCIAGLIAPVLPAFLPEFPAAGIAIGIGALLFIIGAIWFYLTDWDWRNDLFVLGDETITLIHKRPLWLQNEVQRVRLAQVDNVVSDVTGFLNNLLNRGNVRISLIGSNELKVFDKIYDPAEVQAEISRRQAAFKARAQESEVRSQRQAIADYLAVYHQTIGSVTSPTVGMAPVEPPLFDAHNPPPAQFVPGTPPPGPGYSSQQTTPNALPNFTVRGQPPPNTDAAPPPQDGARPPRIPRKRTGGLD